MLIVSESPQNYKNIGECNQLTNEFVEWICEFVEGVQEYSVNTTVYRKTGSTTKNGKYKNAMYFSIKKTYL